MGFNLIYWTHMGSSYFLVCSNLKKCGFFFEKWQFIWADMGGGRA